MAHRPHPPVLAAEEAAAMKPIFLLLSLTLATSACARESIANGAPASTAGAKPAAPVAAAAGASASEAAKPAKPAAASLASPSALPLVVVHKSPTCGCCGAWVDHLRGEGFTVEVRETDDLNPIKERVGVPHGKGSCHTAEIGGYFVEGHVPAADIKRLLEEKPRAKGLVLPGMPLGSPGMEVPDGTVQPYTVELVEDSGTTRPYAEHGPGSAP